MKAKEWQQIFKECRDIAYKDWQSTSSIADLTAYTIFRDLENSPTLSKLANESYG